GVSVELIAKGAITPRVETLSSPARLVVDLPNTSLATSVSRIAVGNSGVTDVRIGTDSSATNRVVVDLEQPAKYELIPGPGGKLTLKLDSGSQMAKTSVASAPKTVAPVVTAALTVPADPKPQDGKPAAQDFVLVEPSYAPKKDVAPVETPARVVEAASRFVERPEGNLLPAANAAMPAQAASAPASG